MSAVSRRSSSGGGIAYEGDKLVENMTLEDGIITMPKEDNNSSHEPIEYEIGLTTETDYVPIKIIWKGQYPTIRKKKLEDGWEEEYDLYIVGEYDISGDGYYYKQVGSTVQRVERTNLGDKQEIPQDVFKYAHDVTDFSRTFFGCSGLTSIPDGLFDNNISVTTFDATFQSCSNLTSIPEDLFDNNTTVTSFSSAFSDCSSLTSVPEGLFDNCPAVTTFGSTFFGCSSLTSIPEGLFDNCPAVTSFSHTFYYCNSLTGTTPTVTTKDGQKYKLWELAGKQGYPKQINGKLCFRGGNKLDDYDDIPEEWKHD